MPKFPHNCSMCRFIGSFQSDNLGLVDLYACGEILPNPGFCCRFGSDPDDVWWSHYGIPAGREDPAFSIAKRRYQEVN